MRDEQRFAESKRSREHPFKLYNHSKRLTVKLTDIEEGWELDKTTAEQTYHCDKGNSRGFRSVHALDFAVKPIEGRKVKGFSCKIKFQQEGDEVVNDIYVNPGFTPLKRLEQVNSSRQNSTGSSVQEITPGSSTFSAPEEMRWDNFGKKEKFHTGLRKSQSLNVPRQKYIESYDPQVTLHTCRSSKNTDKCPTSSAPEESDDGNLDKISKPPQESKLLSSLLDNRPFLEKVCNRLDTRRPGVGDYHDVSLHYGIDSYKVTAVFEKQEVGPSRALLEHLAATRPQLTVVEFVGVLRKNGGREDVAELLNKYNNQ